jgi:hypothetical protein
LNVTGQGSARRRPEADALEHPRMQLGQRRKTGQFIWLRGTLPAPDSSRSVRCAWFLSVSSISASDAETGPDATCYVAMCHGNIATCRRLDASLRRRTPQMHRERSYDPASATYIGPDGRTPSVPVGASSPPVPGFDGYPGRRSGTRRTSSAWPGAEWLSDPEARSARGRRSVTPYARAIHDALA